MNWNYALLSKAAKRAGGPERYLAVLRRKSISYGRKQMYPVVGFAVLGGGLLGWGLCEYAKYLMASKRRIEEVQNSIIQELKDCRCEEEAV